MKKRTIIAAIITLICVVSSNKFWLIYGDAGIDFNVSGKGKTKFETVLYYGQNENRKESVSKTINLDDTSKLTVSVKRAKAPKRLKVIISPQNKLQESAILISDLQLNYEKHKIDAFNNFAVTDAKDYLPKENGALITIANGSAASILYNIPVTMKSDIKFDFYIFVIILVTSFLVFFQLTSYLANFNTRKQHPKTDIIFLVIFFILLFIPMSKISNEKNSRTENRNLSEFKSLIKNGSINFKFGRDFDAWFSDRFAFREKVIRLYSNLFYSINTYYGNDKAFINKNTNWTFIRGHIDSFFSSKKRNLEKYEANIRILKDFCDRQNIKLYILIVPSYADIYREEVYPYFLENKEDPFARIMPQIEKNTGINFIYPRAEILEAKNEDFVFFKTDHHWTDLGVFAGYKALMKTIIKDFPGIKIQERDDYTTFKNNRVRGDSDRAFKNGDTYRMMNLMDKKVLDTDYLYFEHKKSGLLQTLLKDKKTIAREFFHPDGADYRALMLCNSMGENLLEFLPYTFKHFKILRANNSLVQGKKMYSMSRFEKDIVDYKPDVLIFCISTYISNVFENLY
jgi:hypothetical protein